MSINKPCVNLITGIRQETPPIGMWLDFSHITPEETVEEIMKRAWDEALSKE